VDDCNALGYVPLRWDVVPDCKVAWREHDFWNRHRRSYGERINPDLILSCYASSPFRSSYKFRHVPHAVDTSVFHAGNGQDRPYRIGFYGKHGGMYRHRTEARRVIRQIEGAWVGTHGGYWKNGRPHNDGVHTFYNGTLADALRKVRVLWVDSPDRFNAGVLKYFEGGACGCILIGEKPSGSEFPADNVVVCEPEEIPDMLDHLHPQLGALAANEVKQKHSVEVRAGEIVDLLGMKP